MVAADLQAVGINAEAKPVDFNLWQRSHFECTFDMQLDNNTTLSSSPNQYLSAVATQVFDEKNNTRGNWGQYNERQAQGPHESVRHDEPRHRYGQGARRS